MYWVAALLSAIIWVLGWSSGFLGLRVHLFAFLSLIAILLALLPARGGGEASDEGAADARPDERTTDANAKSVPGDEARDRSERASAAAAPPPTSSDMADSSR